jgi:ABC-type phosphonate transport system ATPase subunit
MHSSDDQKELVLTGEHESGKSYALNLIAVDSAAAGEFVLYQCESKQMVQCRMSELRRIVAQRNDIEAVSHSASNCRIEFLGGGRILIGIHSRGLTPDVHLMDNVDEDWSFATKRVVRTVLA